MKKLIVFLSTIMVISGCTSSRDILAQNQMTIQNLKNQVIDLRAENQGLQQQLEQSKQGRIPSGVVAVDAGNSRGGYYQNNISPGTVVSAQPTGGYEDALQLYRAGDIDGAIAGFQQFLQTGVTGEEAALAQYWIGDAYYSKRAYHEAQRYFGTFLKNMPESDKTNAALRKLITSLKAIGRNADAEVLKTQGVSAIQ